MTDVTDRPAGGNHPAWLLVCGRELQDLWLTGRGLTLMLAFTVLLSITTYLVASTQDLNFVEQRASVSLTLQVVVAVGGLLVLLATTDAISGERERGTLESLLLTPVSRRSLVAGKGLAAMSLWVVAFALAIPYLLFLGNGIGIVGTALWSGLLVGSLLTMSVAGLGMLVSIFSGSNRMSLSVGVLLLLALYAPTQIPSYALRGWVGDLLAAVDPFMGGLLYLEGLVLDGRAPTQDVILLIAPLVAAAASAVAAMACARRLALLPRVRS